MVMRGRHLHLAARLKQQCELIPNVPLRLAVVVEDRTIGPGGCEQEQHIKNEHIL